VYLFKEEKMREYYQPFALRVRLASREHHTCVITSISCTDLVLHKSELVTNLRLNITSSYVRYFRVCAFNKTLY